nr:GNAT family N-acetyltransferase [Mesobacterium pallidum]
MRAATPLDAGPVGAILTDFAEATPWLPRLHSGAEDIAFAGRMIDRGWVTVAEKGAVLGFLAQDGEEVACLYTATPGKGIGKALIAHAKSGQGRLELWTFQANARARRFYRREGFAEVATSDGAHTDEGLPDVRLVWQRKDVP